MGDTTKIVWADRTFSPWEGCQKVGPGCEHCYAETRNNRFAGGNWGPGAPRRVMSDSYWRNPWRWDAQAKDEGVMSSVFPSLCDPFDNAAPEGQRMRFANLIMGTPNLRWLLLTKRIGNAAAMLAEMFPPGTPDNVWLGTTIVNQAEADRDIPKLFRVPARVRFLSMEPLLGPVDLTRVKRFAAGVADKEWLNAIDGRVWTDQTGLPNPDPSWIYPGRAFSDGTGGLDWVIAGGESGPGARPSHPDWYRSLRDQCAAAGVPFLFKQWGEWAPYRPVAGGDLRGDVQAGRVTIVHPSGDDDDTIIDRSGGRLSEPGSRYMARIGKKLAGRMLDGVRHDGLPA